MYRPGQIESLIEKGENLGICKEIGQKHLSF